MLSCAVPRLAYSRLSLPLATLTDPVHHLNAVLYCSAYFRWKQDAITLIDKLLPESYQEVIIVGGGVGGWIATLIALERPEKGEENGGWELAD